ncbi:MAG: deoxyribodipyrimidine photo-lyase [Geminicoccaceae bacterium]|nr:deoxyribodipyrimidine photo-lyase [Geminicoccaceae bacterium]
MTKTGFVWFRDDLRLKDNPVLKAAAESGLHLIALYVLDDAAAGAWARGAAGRWWLHANLLSLKADLDRLGVPLVLRRGDAVAEVAAVAEAAGAEEAFWNRRYAAFAEGQDRAIAAALEGRGVAVRAFDGAVMRPPGAVERRTGGHYRMFTPYLKAWRALGAPDAPLPAPASLKGWQGRIRSDAPEDWKLAPSAPDWAGGMRAAWPPGEAAAAERLERFVEEGLDAYGTARNRPAQDGTSRLSPYLHLGVIGPRHVWHAAGARGDGAWPFLTELVWRDFSHHTLHHFPDLPDRPMREAFEAYPWRHDPAALRAWQRGRTGYPIVDAGMRQLWATGWMHNRVRMITASFLVKDLGLDWREGERWFWDCLVDADLANNAINWQWVAGTGIDASPFFRVFNPTTQGRKFDPKGDYVRRWVPELARLGPAQIHAPWEAPEEALAAAGVRLGHDYPRPIVDHGRARDRALADLRGLRRGG